MTAGHAAESQCSGDMHALLQRRAALWKKRTHIIELLKYAQRKCRLAGKTAALELEPGESNGEIANVFWSGDARFLLVQQSVEAELYSLCSGKWRLHRRVSVGSRTKVLGVTDTGLVLLARPSKLVLSGDMGDEAIAIPNVENCSPKIDVAQNRVWFVEHTRVVSVDLGTREVTQFDHSLPILCLASDRSGATCIQDPEAIRHFHGQAILHSIPFRAAEHADARCLLVKRLTDDMHWVLLTRPIAGNDPARCPGGDGNLELVTRVLRGAECVHESSHVGSITLVQLSGESVFGYDPAGQRIVQLSLPDLTEMRSIPVGTLPTRLVVPHTLATFLVVFYADRPPRFVSLCE